MASDIQGTPSSHQIASGSLTFVCVLRQKALVLLEYLVKNGSERVIDDARSHISMIKIMRNFHYIDEKGKDQGVNSELPLRRKNESVCVCV